MATKKQGELKGIEKKVIKEVDDAALEYREVRDDRMALTKKEVELQAALLAMMKKHKLKSYCLTDGEQEWDVEIEPSEEVVRVRKSKGKAKAKKASKAAKEAEESEANGAEHHPES